MGRRNYLSIEWLFRARSWPALARAWGYTVRVPVELGAAVTIWRLCSYENLGRNAQYALVL